MGLNLNTPQAKNYTGLNPVRSGSTIEPDTSVKYTPQTLTEEQQAQARQNIGAAAEGEGGGATINEFHYLRDTSTDPATYYIDADDYEPQEGDLMTIVWDWPFRTDENDPDAAFKNPATLKNNSTNPSIYIKNAHQMATNYDEIDPEVNTRWTVRLEKVNDVWYAYNISTAVQPDWNTVDNNLPSYIKNKPTIPNFLSSSNPVMLDKRTAELFFTRRNSVSLSAKYDWMWTPYTVYKSSDPTQSQSIDMGDVSHAYLHFPTGGYWSTDEFNMNIYNDNEVWMWINDLDNGAVYYNQINFNSNGKFNVVYKGDFEVYRFGFSTNKTNHPEQCWAWFMSNNYDGDYTSDPQYGNLVLADATMANFKILSSGSLSSLITFDIYVPASRLTEFETRMQTLYGTSEYTSYIEPKVHTYDFIAQSGLTLKMINLG